MIYKLNKQILNERRHNIWIWLEMFIVSIVLWYIVDMLYVKYTIYNEPRGHNIESVYQVMTDILLPSNPDYVLAEKSHRSSGQDVLDIAQRLRQREDVEDVCISFLASPYNINYNYNSFSIIPERYESFLVRQVTPEYFNVFQCISEDGRPIKEIVEKMKADKSGVVVSAKNLSDTIKLKIGSNLQNTFGVYTIVGTIPCFKQTDYSDDKHNLLFQNLTENEIRRMEEHYSRALEISVRVKSGEEDGFSERLLADADKYYRVGNRFIKTVIPMNIIRSNIQMNNSKNIRNNVFICAFLLLNIFFGLLGTFWFRTQQRAEEMALHLVLGSSRVKIFFRLICEGIILLVLATIPALITDGYIASVGLNDSYQGETLTIGRFVVTTGISFTAMCVMVIVGTMIPALRSRKLEITTVLQEN